MAAISVSALKDRLNTKLRDSTDRTFSSAEKDEFIESAIDDDYVFTITRDSTLTTVSEQASYTVPTGISDVLEVWVDENSDGYPQLVDRQGYDVIDGTLYFDAPHKYITAGRTITIVGKKKLTTADTIPDLLKNYVLELALIQAYEELAHTYTTRFLKNDVTLGEILGAIRSMQGKIADMRRTLNNRRQVLG